MPFREISSGGRPVMSSPLNSDAARGRAQHAGQAVEERALAGAVRADDGADLAALNSKLTLLSAVSPPKRIVSPSVRSTGAASPPRPVSAGEADSS